jgi:multidrug efflux system membrane fusion protein
MSTEINKSASRVKPRIWPAVLVVLLVVAIVAISGRYLATHAATPQSSGRGGSGPPAAGPPGAGAPGAAGGGRGGGQPLPVGTAAVTKGDIRIILNALGTVTPLRDVTVSAQVSGQLVSVAFKEGQLVNQGDILAQIDPRSYQAALMQAEGALVRDQALLAEARIDLDRYQTLFKEDSIAKQQLDTQRSLVHQYEGTAQADQGQIDAAKVNLAYTRITAPVTGRVGLRQVDPGNNVSSGSSIVILTQLKPMDVLFTLPEDNLPAVVTKMHAGATLATDAYDRAGSNKLASGNLASLDNQIDTSTGTVKAKAEFGNDDDSLFPNQFVNVRLMLDVLRDAIVIPTSALERGSGGLFVYVVQPDKTVAVRNIKTGPTEGERVAVTDGLEVGEVVVTSGADKLRDGSKVELPGDMPKPSAVASTGQNGPGQSAAQGQRHGHGQHRHSGSQGSSPNDSGQGGPAQSGPAQSGSGKSSPPGAASQGGGGNGS